MIGNLKIQMFDSRAQHRVTIIFLVTTQLDQMHFIYTASSGIFLTRNKNE